MPLIDKALCMADDIWYFDWAIAKTFAAFLKGRSGDRFPDAEKFAASETIINRSWRQINKAYNAVLKNEILAGKPYSDEELKKAFSLALSVCGK